MNVFVVRDGIFTVKDGMPASNLLHYDAYGKRFAQVFESTTIVGRLFDKNDVTALPVQGNLVSFEALPGYHGPIGFLKSLPKTLKVLLGTVRPGCGYILRVPATIPSIYAFILYFRGVPFAIELAADPYDSYSPKALDNHPLSKIFQKIFVSLTTWQCHSAAVTAYVTRNALQSKYPPADGAPSFSFTSLDLTDEAFVCEPRTVDAFNRTSPHIVLTGNMQGSMKGHDTLLEAAREVVKEYPKLRLSIIGYGSNEGKFKKMAADFGLSENVRFLGKMPAGKAIRDVLDSADLFVLPSRQEGLPRALLEAMARGLPAVATSVGGTPELLAEDSLVPPDQPEALARQILDTLKSSAVMAEKSSRNLSVAKEYHVDIVSKRRNDFFEAVKTATNSYGKK